MDQGQEINSRINNVKADYKNAVKSFADMVSLFKSGLNFAEVDNLQRLISSCRLCHESLFGAFEAVLKILTGELEESIAGRSFPTLISLSRNLLKISAGLKKGVAYPGLTMDYTTVEKVDLNKIVSTKDVRNDLTHRSIIREARHYESLFENLMRLIKILAPDFDAIVPSNAQQLEQETFGHFLSHVKFEDVWTPPAHILIMDPVWDIPNEQVSLLLSLPWDIIIDLDGRSIGYWERKNDRREYHITALSRVQQIIESTGRKTIPIFAINPNENNYLMIKNHERIPYLNYSDADIALNINTEPSLDAFTNIVRHAKNDKKTAQENQATKQRKSNTMARFFKEYLSPYDSAVIVSLAEAFSQDNSTQQIIHEIFKKIDGDIQVALVQDTLDNKIALPIWIDDAQCMTWDCETSTFFDEIYKNRDVLSGLMSVKNEKNRANSYRFILRDKLEKYIPRDGIIKEVEDYFELLHLDVGNEISEDGEELFYRGHLAQWSALKNDCDTDIAPNTHNKLVQRIKSSFTTDPEVENTYFILHEPGSGATTLGRRIAWDIHKDFPVAVLRQFDSKLLDNRINSLYRALENTPFLILVDSSNGISDDDIDEFVKLMRHQDIPIVALVVRRKHSNQSGKNVYTLPKLDSASIDAIKSRCMKCALPLYDSREEMLAHADELDKYIAKKDQTPMIINMYIMDKEFKKPEAYVRSFIDKGTLPENISNILIYVSLYSLYTDQELPIRFIRSIYNADHSLQENKAFQITMQCYDKLLLYKAAPFTKSPDSVRCIHSLFAVEILRWLKGDSWESFLAEMSIDFVESAMPVLTDEAITKSLAWLFARKSRSYADETSSKMTKLIDAVMTRTIRSAGIELLEKGANRVAEYISEHESHIEEHKATDYSHILSLNARLWAQCARYYRDGASYDEAMMDKYTDLSLKVLDQENLDVQRGFQDIYHMAGMCWYKKLDNLFQNAPDDSSDENIAQIKKIFYITLDYFEKCVQFGNLDYGLPSMMSVYSLTVNYIFNMLNFLKGDYRPEKLDDPKFSWVQEDVIEAANQLIDNANQYDLSDDATALFFKYADEFRNIYMLEDNSRLLQDLNNYIERLKINDQEHPVSLQQAYAQRVYYILKKYYNKELKSYNYLALYENKKDLEKVSSSIDSALAYSGRKQNYLYKIWFKLAKLDDVSFAKAKQKALDWAGLIAGQRRTSQHRNETAPYYYMYVISLLSKQPDILVKNDWNMLQRNNDINEKNRNEEWILDYYTSGKTGMGSLVDRDWAPYDGIRDNSKISWVKGRIVHIAPDEIVGGIDVDKSIVDLSRKQHKTQGQVFFKPRTADKTINQIGDEIKFKFGFTLTRIRAVDNTIPDRKPRESKNVGIKTVVDIPSNWVQFKPEWISKSKKDQSPVLLIGKVGDQKAALPIWDIRKYADSELSSLGGAPNVLICLKEKKDIYVVIEKETEHGINVSLHATGQKLREVVK